MNTEKFKKLFKNKVFRMILAGVAAFLLLFAVWRVFFRKTEPASADYVPTDTEARLARLLEKIEGVEGATVMIGEEKGEAVSAVVIVRGDLGLLTRMRIVDAAANALGIARQDVLVYPAD